MPANIRPTYGRIGDNQWAMAEMRNIMAQDKMTIKQWREKLNMTQFELAVKSGVSIKSISNAETGKQLLNMSNSLKIVKALGITLDNVIWIMDDNK